MDLKETDSICPISVAQKHASCFFLYTVMTRKTTNNKNRRFSVKASIRNSAVGTK